MVDGVYMSTQQRCTYARWALECKEIFLFLLSHQETCTLESMYIYSSKSLINVDITVACSTLMNKLVKKEKNMKWRSVFKCL